MMHNAIEHSDMQLISETYSILSDLLHHANERGGLLRPLEPGRLRSHWIEITAKVLARRTWPCRPSI
jgi:6-phosphogluconate dehydrogenase